MLTVGESGGAGQPLEAVSRCKGRARSGVDDAGVPAEGSETDAILDAV
jgi:hypothetical protein